MLEGINLFPPQPHLACQLVPGKDIARQQEGHILLQLFQRLTKATADGRDFSQLFRRQIVEVLVRGRARVDLVLDAIKAVSVEVMDVVRMGCGRIAKPWVVVDTGAMAWRLGF